MFSLKQNGWQLSEIENLIPWELEVFLNITEQYVEEENEKHKQEMQRHGKR